MYAFQGDVEGLRAVVSRYFNVYEVTVNPAALTFHVHADPLTLDAQFDGLRTELVPQHYIPTIVHQGGEFLVHVQQRPKSKYTGLHVNIAFLAITLGTTLVAGAWNWSEYAGTPLFGAESFALGFLSFSLPLLTILGAHEMGHYLVSKRYRVHASLPFFLPSIPPLGTFGAFISMRDPIPNRRALLDIGISGPLVGFAIAIPVTLLGLFLSAADPKPLGTNIGGQEVIASSYLFGLLMLFFPLPPMFTVHPTAFAGWVGLFVTAINLLPAGQLDGGHVARALLGDNAKYLSAGAVVGLFALSFFYGGWFIFALLILFLGIRHPPPLNDITRLSPGRRAVGLLAVVILLSTFVPTPFGIVAERPDFVFAAPAPSNATTNLTLDVRAGTAQTATFYVNNTGNVLANVTLSLQDENLIRLGWIVTVTELTPSDDGARTVSPGTANVTFVLNATEFMRVRVEIAVPPGFLPGSYTVRYVGSMAGYERTRDLAIHVNVT